MPYAKTVWKDRAVQFPNRFIKSEETGDQVTLIQSPGTITQVGTPINAAVLNKLEQGVADSLPKGTDNTEIANLFTLINEVDTRSVFITRTNDVISKIEEKNGSSVIRTTIINRTNGLISSVVQIAGEKTVTYSINRDPITFSIISVTKNVV